MKSTLRIRLSGEAHGLTTGGLSADSFGEMLPLLLAALRRVGSNIAKRSKARSLDARGRIAEMARGLDLCLMGIEPGSVCPVLECTFASVEPVEPGLFDNDFMHNAMAGLTKEIEAGGSGRNAIPEVRNYLASIPPDIDHEYTLSRGSAVVRRITVKGRKLAPAPEPLPSLRRATGLLTHARFGDDSAVRIGNDQWMRATAEQFARAIDLRDVSLTALAVDAGDGEEPRLLWLKEASEPEVTGNESERADRVMAKWSELLRRLAR